jgi:hypothetical protein
MSSGDSEPPRPQRLANLDLLIVDVAAPALQAVDLGVSCVVLLLALAKCDVVLGEYVLQLGIAREVCSRQRSSWLRCAPKLPARPQRALAQYRCQLGVAFRLGRRASRKLLLLRMSAASRSRRSPPFSPIACFSSSTWCACSSRLASKRRTCIARSHSSPKQAEALVQQFHLQAGEVRAQAFAAAAQRFHLTDQARDAGRSRRPGASAVRPAAAP